MRLHPVLPGYAPVDNPRWLAVVVTAIPLLLAAMVSLLPMRVWFPIADQKITHERPFLARTP